MGVGHPQHRNALVPSWARDAVWYQVFPERFRNGCPASNPRMEDLADAPVPGWEVTDWVHDWYALDSWEKPFGSFYKSVYYRRFGGDLVGVREKLDYLQDLGINAIYLNPVFMAPSLHKYDASCMHHIDPTLGPDREGDLQKLAAADETEDPSTWIWTEADRCFFELVDDVHSRGMRIIIDGVFNHCGRRFFAFRDLLKRGKTSRYRDWFRGVRWLKDGTFQYKGWFGHKALPEFARSKEDLASPVSDYIFAITKRWMAPDAPGLSGRGVDGWRLDVAFCVPHGFWRRWRKHVKEIDRDAFICGEIVKNARAYLQGDELDAVMNYAWTYPTVAFFCPSANPMPAKELKRQLTRLRRSYPPDVNGVLQNLLDSHDVGRILTFLHNPELPKGGWDDYFGATRASSNKQLKTTRPGPRTQDILRQVVIFQMTYLGAPMIYYGTEAGMWGANDPDNRQPMLWDDIDYEPETHTPTGRCAAAERKPDAALFGFYKRAINLRKTQSALRHGSIQWIRCSNARLLMFERCWRDERLLVALNASDSDVIWSSHISGRDVWTGERVSDKDERTIPPRGWLIIKAE